MLAGLRPKRRGRKAKPKNPLAAENERLQRENQRLTEKLRQAEAIIDVQKKVAPRKLGRRGFCPLGRMKLLIETLCGREPVRQSITSSRKRVLRGVRATGTAKRRQ
jgi:hypothetical protein